MPNKMEGYPFYLWLGNWKTQESSKMKQNLHWCLNAFFLREEKNSKYTFFWIQMQMKLEEPNVHVRFKVILTNLVLFFIFVPLRFVPL